MSFINMIRNASYNFVAPNIAADADSKVEVIFPTSEKQEIAYATTIAATVERAITLLDLGTLTGAATLNLTVGAYVPVGALLTVKAKSDTTARDITLGTGLTGPTLAGVISKTKSQSFMYDGAKFIAMAAAVQLD